MKFNVDGACRGNGRPGAIAVAAACMFSRNGRYRTRTSYLPRNPVATNQRAEITAIILALQWAVDHHEQMLKQWTRVNITIRSDSRYAVDSMTTWIHKWIDNGWYNAAGRPVANSDLFLQAQQLEYEISFFGTVTYIWVPRWENQAPDAECNQALDQIYM
ncbi:hypothetical protein ABW20_dc0106713 [Dactylellina cionopaga]|nr:hypothetical protein ABW20_dc0106713 [Dactylellina cionopaga]